MKEEEKKVLRVHVKRVMGESICFLYGEKRTKKNSYAFAAA
jgi:hypothetical protein